MLVRTHIPLTGLRVQELAGRSYSRVRLVLQRLVDHGVVLAERHGGASSYVLNRSHLLAGPLEEMVGAASSLEAAIADVADRFEQRPQAVVLFGSFARRDGDAGSDIDVLVVRPDDVDEDEGTWAAQRIELVEQLERWSGNRVQLVELSVAELDEAVARREPLIDSLRRDAVVVAGAAPSLTRSLTAVGRT